LDQGIIYRGAEGSGEGRSNVARRLTRRGAGEVAGRLPALLALGMGVSWPPGLGGRCAVEGPPGLGRPRTWARRALRRAQWRRLKELAACACAAACRSSPGPSSTPAPSGEAGAQEEIVHVPEVMTQERVYNQYVEEIADAVAEQKAEEISHGPVIQLEEKIVQNEAGVVAEVLKPQISTQERVGNQCVEEIVDAGAEQKVEEIFHGPVIQLGEKFVQNEVGAVTEVLKPQVISARSSSSGVAACTPSSGPSPARGYPSASAGLLVGCSFSGAAPSSFTGSPCQSACGDDVEVAVSYFLVRLWEELAGEADAPGSALDYVHDLTAQLIEEDGECGLRDVLLASSREVVSAFMFWAKAGVFKGDGMDGMEAAVSEVIPADG